MVPFSIIFLADFSITIYKWKHYFIEEVGEKKPNGYLCEKVRNGISETFRSEKVRNGIIV